MSEAKHTPGPWQAIAESGPLVRDGNTWWRIYTDDGDDSEFVAEVGRTADAKPHERAADAANARLIAAAPDLLAACQLWDQGFTEGEQFTAEQFRRWVNANRRAARAAIAKATGQESR